MDKLHFGTRARRRALRRSRLKRVGLVAWVAALAGMALGLPGPSVGLDLLGQIAGRQQQVLTSSAGSSIDTTTSAASAMRFRREVFDARPTPKVSPTPTPAATAPETVAAAPAAPAGSITDIIYRAAAEYGISGSYLVSVAQCESGLNPNAYNAAGYHGLFQYDSTTWAANGYGSIYDPVAQARTTARLLAAGQSSRWPNCA